MGNLTKNQLKLIDILISNKNLFSEFCKLNSLDDMYTYSKKLIGNISEFEVMDLMLKCVFYVKRELLNISELNRISGGFMKNMFASILVAPLLINSGGFAISQDHKNSNFDNDTYIIKQNEDSKENKTNSEKFKKFITNIGIVVLSSSAVVGSGLWYKNSDNFFQRSVIGNSDSLTEKTGNFDISVEYDKEKVIIDNLNGYIYRPKSQIFSNISDKYVIFYSGSGSSNEAQIPEVLDFYLSKNITVVGVNYTGFGSDSSEKISSGKIRESMLYSDAQKIYNYVNKNLKINSENIILHGFSLGGAMAAHVAFNVTEKNQKLCGLILQSSIKNSYHSANQILKTENSIVRLIGTIGTYLFADQFNSVKELKRLLKNNPDVPIAVCGGDSIKDGLSLESTKLDDFLTKTGFKNVKIYVGIEGHTKNFYKDNIYSAPKENFVLPENIT